MSAPLSMALSTSALCSPIMSFALSKMPTSASKGQCRFLTLAEPTDSWLVRCAGERLFSAPTRRCARRGCARTPPRTPTPAGCRWAQVPPPTDRTRPSCDLAHWRATLLIGADARTSPSVCEEGSGRTGEGSRGELRGERRDCPGDRGGGGSDGGREVVARAAAGSGADPGGPTDR